MTRKFAGKQDYAVCKLEGQWFFNRDPSAIPKDQWKWKLLIRTPEFIPLKDLQAAVIILLKRGKSRVVEDVKLETIDEGLCIQMLHIGPYERENKSLALMRDCALANSVKLNGPHHEIYLSDPRRVPPERLRTILCVPVIKQGNARSCSTASVMLPDRNLLFWPAHVLGAARVNNEFDPRRKKGFHFRGVMSQTKP